MNRASNRRPIEWTILALDAAILLAVPVALAAIQFGGSPALHRLLTFDSDQPTLLGWVGHWAVHYSSPLLLANLLGYALVAGVGYPLAWAMGERWWFRLSLGAVLLAVPPLSAAASDLAFARIAPGLTYTARGASAVVAGLLGVLAVLFLGRLEQRYDTRAAVVGGGALFVGVLTGLLVHLGSPARAEVVTFLGAVGLIVGFDLALRLREGDAGTSEPSLRQRIGWQRLGWTLLVGVVVFVVTLAMAVALFPADPFAGPRITNVFGHAMGLATGAVIACWGRRYWSSRSWW
ncbi:MAG: hypothetical protein ABEJ60_02925 [Halodesulfurarchaeum sp.]